MFELFIALFGGLYYAGKSIHEKSLDRESKKWQSKRDATLEHIRTNYETDYELRTWAQEFIASGKHYDEICEWFAEDFEYVLGSDWREKLRLPNPSLPWVRLYGKSKKTYPWSMPSTHIMWVFHLLLAKHGKIDWFITGHGYSVGGIHDAEMNIKFAERIEHQLMKAGVQDIRLALELDDFGGTRRTPDRPYGGNIQIESLCIFPSCRLW